MNKFNLEEYLSENSDEILKNKIDKNRKDIIAFLDKIIVKPKDNKDFFRNIFKIISTLFEGFSDDEMLSIHSIIDISILSKIALLLKYKEGLNYREKIKMIKEVAKDVSFEELLFLENFIESELKTIEDEKNSIDGIDLYKNIDKKLLYRHLIIYLNIIVLLKCVLFDYHRKELMYYENGKPKFKIVPIKNIQPLSLDIKITSKINIDDFMDLFLDYEKNKGHLIYDIDLELITTLCNAYINYRVKLDEYNKLILDKQYNELLTNRITKFYKINFVTGSNLVFMKRKILIPKNGVILLIEDEISPIESILIKEKVLYNRNHIYFITRYKDGTEIMNTILVNENFKHNAYNFLGSICEFQGLYQNTLSYILHFLEVSSIISECVSLNYSVISPVYWKYRKKGYVSSNDKVNKLGVVVKREFDIEIAPFLRRINGTPSNDAIKLSKELGVILEDGYTIVKPHTRTYNRVK